LSGKPTFPAKNLEKLKVRGKRSTKNSTTSPAAIRREKEREEALYQRLCGLSFYQIGEQLGFSKTKAELLVNEALASMTLEPTEDMIKMEVSRLDMAINGLQAKIVTGDDISINTMLRVMERRARYFGLDKPIEHKTEYSGRLDGKQEIAVSGKVDHGGTVTIEFVQPKAIEGAVEEAQVIETIPPEKKNGGGNGSA
jgi:hypothetical protein